MKKIEYNLRKARIILFVFILLLNIPQFNSKELFLAQKWWPFPWPKPDEPVNGEIRWDRSCGDKTNSSLFECGTLYTPLDYTSKNDTRQARISIIRYKAGGGKTKREDVLGSVLLNPGGPGGSGVGFLAKLDFTTKIDHQLGGRYDLVSFDPRGVGYTYPMVQCFDDSDKAGFYANSNGAYGRPGQHGAKVMKHEIGYMLAGFKLLGSVCKEHPDSELFQFMSTAFVARDMRLLHKALGDKKINYWGLSYGSALGATYAAMFPDDINRMTIDGVLDFNDYYQGIWGDNTVNAEEVLTGFFKECTKAGSERCKLASLVGENEDLHIFVMNWASKLKINPVVVVNANPPRLLTYGDVIDKLFQHIYAPKRWPQLADSLYEGIHKGNYTTFLDNIDFHSHNNVESEAAYAIACSDAIIEASGPDDSWSIEDFEKFWKPSREDSPNFSIYDIEYSTMCHGNWQIRGAERYNGSFNTNTSFPLLFLGNDLDPVTPGRNADKMSKLFEGSASVRRAGYGHCSMSQPSKCIDNIVYNYFVLGELPVSGTYCELDSGPFDKETESHVSISDFLIRPQFRF